MENEEMRLVSRPRILLTFLPHLNSRCLSGRARATSSWHAKMWSSWRDSSEPTRLHNNFFRCFPEISGNWYLSLPTPPGTLLFCGLTLRVLCSPGCVLLPMTFWPRLRLGMLMLAIPFRTATLRAMRVTRRKMPFASSHVPASQ